MLSIRYSVYTLLSFAQTVFCALQFQRLEDLPTIDYDFVIVGGGTAGAVVASRLSENRDLKVLMIEAGPSNEEIFGSQVPGLMGSIGFGTRADWNYSTTPQAHVSGVVLPYARAMMLGGCSSHNGMVYTRGSRDDYNRWASITDDDNLSWNKILPYILKTEKWSDPNDPNFPEQNHFDPSFHNFHGKVGVSGPYGLHPFYDLLFETTNSSKGEFPFLLDQNSGRPLGISWGQFTIVQGVRTSSATGYLPDTRDNLHVLLNTRVTRILPVDHEDDRPDNVPDFRTVEFAAGPEAPRHTLTATKEIILSGGVINTPQLLLNSGVGPKNALEALGISTLINNPSVGQNFTDQVSITIHFATNLPSTAFNSTAALAEWTSSHTGPLALPPFFSPFGWIRFPGDADVFKNGSSDPTAGQNSPHVEFFFAHINNSTGTEGQDGDLIFSMIVVNLHPVSRGSITISSSSPFSPPIIDPNLLGSSSDSSILVEGILTAQRLFSLPGFSKNFFGITTPAPSSGSTLTNDDIIKYVQTNASHFGHGIGSCSMAPRGSTWGVVDPDFLVRGARGLRIVDASVIPYITSGHTQAPVYAMAEWASAVIKQAWD